MIIILTCGTAASTIAILLLDLENPVTIHCRIDRDESLAAITIMAGDLKERTHAVRRYFVCYYVPYN